MSDEVYREIEVELDRDDTLPFVQALDDGRLEDLSGYYEVLYDEERERNDQARLVLYFPITAELAGSRVEILLESLGLSNRRVTEKEIARQDYLEAYKQYYEPFVLSPRLAIIPSWDRGGERERAVLEREADVRALYLDPGLAFGTGKHPTTELCIRYLDDLAGETGLTGKTLIDAGAGSGVLALAALLFGAQHVYAFDIDGNSATACEQNLRLNETIAPERLRFEHGGFDVPGLAETPAELMLGNLTAAVLIANSAFIDRARTDRLVLSGVLVEQQDDVCRAFADEWKLTGQAEKEGWVLLELERRVQST